ncbi:BRO family protein [Sphingomonas sp. PB2P12]|uniref:BRO-N domain-containing protein n=1 Tax=Sphingomonas sandaracina TaxID=3096157 RepID=UPI002FCAA943
MTTARITPFLFEGEHTVRQIEIDGTPRFVAKDVASALGYKNTKFAVQTHCKHGAAIGGGAFHASLPNIDPQTIIIPESDVYRLILRSKLPAAERFEAWLMEEVLPSLRQAGKFEVPDTVPGMTDDLQMMDSLKLRKVNMCHRLFGERAGQQMWRKVDLEWVPAMASVFSQGDMFDRDNPPGSVTITVGAPEMRKAA